MAIYDLFELEENEPIEVNDKKGEMPQVDANQSVLGKRDRFFSALTARLFFLLLFIADLLWLCYAMVVFCLSVVLMVVTGFKLPFLKYLQSRMWLTMKRACVCGLSLLITLFSPAFGIMIACTYFLMYDKTGIEEVVPASLQSQFKEFFTVS